MATDSAFLTGVTTTSPHATTKGAGETCLTGDTTGLLPSLDETKKEAQLKLTRTAFVEHHIKQPLGPGADAYSDWDQRAVSTFVTTSCDLPQYEDAIKANNITGAHLRELRSHSMLNVGLQRAGITDHSHQKRISDEMLRVESGAPDEEKKRLSQTATDWYSNNPRPQSIQKPVRNRAYWDVKRRELSCGRLVGCYMPGKGEGAERGKPSDNSGASFGRFMYGPRLDLTRTAKMMKQSASMPADLLSSETRKTLQPYDPRKFSEIAGAAASSRGLVTVFD